MDAAESDGRAALTIPLTVVSIKVFVFRCVQGCVCVCGWLSSINKKHNSVISRHNREFQKI